MFSEGVGAFSEGSQQLGVFSEGVGTFSEGVQQLGCLVRGWVHLVKESTVGGV